jgi:hypothetical protein
MGVEIEVGDRMGNRGGRGVFEADVWPCPRRWIGRIEARAEVFQILGRSTSVEP